MNNTLIRIIIFALIISVIYCLFFSKQIENLDCTSSGNGCPLSFCPVCEAALELSIDAVMLAIDSAKCSSSPILCAGKEIVGDALKDQVAEDFKDELTILLNQISAIEKLGKLAIETMVNIIWEFITDNPGSAVDAELVDLLCKKPNCWPCISDLNTVNNCNKDTDCCSKNCVQSSTSSKKYCGSGSAFANSMGDYSRWEATALISNVAALTGSNIPNDGGCCYDHDKGEYSCGPNMRGPVSSDASKTQACINTCTKESNGEMYCRGSSSSSSSSCLSDDEFCCYDHTGGSACAPYWGTSGCAPGTHSSSGCYCELCIGAQKECCGRCTAKSGGLYCE